MLEQLRQTLAELSDDELVNQYQNHNEEYTEEAIQILNEEIRRRKIDLEIMKFNEKSAPEITQLDEKDFIRFDHSLNRIDLELAITILRGNKILFYIDNPSSTNTFPLDSEADKQYSIHVYNKSIDEAHQLLDEHFEKVDGRYQLKNMSILEQLKSFSFSQLHLDEMEANEKVDVDFSDKEKDVIIRYGKIILTDVDKIEKEQEQVIFHFDAIEPLIKHIIDGSVVSFSKMELLAILEILQIASYYEDFPSGMDNTILSLLSFFMEQH